MRYFYYRIYKGLTKVKTNDTPALNAMILLIALQAINILSVFGIINYFFRLEFDKQQVIIGGISLYIILLVPNYIYLFRKRNEIIKRYQNETAPQKTKGVILLLLYIVITITVFFVLGETIVQNHY
ncbi:MAG TPA: hypothetical protein P5531_12705 [Bacteroidales bacterium]|nr:hypothetical protein [Bacteroidales bacterium]HSA44447.1 hypothetical protein [Bacteroidales bacterium]